MKKNLTPGINSTKRKLFPLLGPNGTPTGRALALPASSAPWEEFQLGTVRLQMTHRCVKALDPLPTSWFVDLSAGVQDLSDGA